MPLHIDSALVPRAKSTPVFYEACDKYLILFDYRESACPLVHPLGILRLPPLRWWDGIYWGSLVNILVTLIAMFALSEHTLMMSEVLS